MVRRFYYNECKIFLSCFLFSGKLQINTKNISKTRKGNVKQSEVKENESESFMVDEDCTNNQIDVEECIIANNRYHPCPSPEKDCVRYKNTFEYRSYRFALILRDFGYNLQESIQSFEFGKVPAFEILNYDDEYENYVKKFFNFLIKDVIPEPYGSFRRSIENLQSKIPARSAKLSSFKTALQQVVCQKEILNLPETLENLITLKNKLNKQFKGTDEELEEIDQSMKLFLESYPLHVQEECVNAE